MPVLVRGQGLDETGAFLRRLAFGAADQSGRFEHPIRRRRSHRGHVRIQHHEGQAAVAFQRVLEGVADDSLFSCGSSQWSRGTCQLCSLALP